MARDPLKKDLVEKAALQVTANVFSSLRQKRQGPEAQPCHLVVEGVKFAHGRNMHHLVAKQHHISLEGTAGRDPPAKEVGQAGIADAEVIDSRLDGSQWSLQPVAQVSCRFEVHGSHGTGQLLRSSASTLPRNRCGTHKLSPHTFTFEEGATFDRLRRMKSSIIDNSYALCRVCIEGNISHLSSLC